MSFSFYRSLTCDHTQCGASDSATFPVMVHLSDPTFKDVAHSGHVQSSSGTDIQFYSDTGAVNQLKQEIELYDNVNGIVWAWVQVATLSHTSDTVFYVFYGNPSPPSTAINPWDTSFQAVYHLGDGTTLNVNDSTSNANNATNNLSTALSGAQIDGGAAIAGSSLGAYISIPITNLAYAAGTIEWWYNCTFLFNDSQTHGMWGDDSAGTPEFSAQKFADNNLYVGWNNASGDFRAILAASAANYPQNIWISYVLTYVSGGVCTLYANGASIATGSSGLVETSPGVVTKMSQVNGLKADANMDEFRISNTARGVDWILSKYNNEKTSSTFLTVGAETAAGGGGILWFHS